MTQASQWACRNCAAPFEYPANQTPHFCPYCRSQDLELSGALYWPDHGAQPLTIAQLDAQLLPLIEAAREAGDQRFVDRALEARTMAFSGGEAGRWFLQGFIMGRKERPR